VTVNKELAALRRAFNLAVKARRLPPSARPFISTRTRTTLGILRGSRLPRRPSRATGTTPPCFSVAYLTGWRVPSEVMALTWAQLGFAAGIIRLEPRTTKTDQGRTFPFAALPELASLLHRRRCPAQEGLADDTHLQSGLIRKGVDDLTLPPLNAQPV
jgi:hypothetical protein